MVCRDEMIHVEDSKLIVFSIVERSIDRRMSSVHSGLLRLLLLYLSPWTNLGKM